MKPALLVLSLVILNATVVFACDDFSGTYSSAAPKIGKRIYRITQDGCVLKVELNNAGSVVDPDMVKADNLAYGRASNNFDGNGHLINPFQLASAASTRFVRTKIANGILFISELSDWKTTGQCEERFIYQKDCSYTQRTFSKNGDDLVETFNGYWYSDGQHRPFSIRYIKIN